jgi:hypothetical protein
MQLISKAEGAKFQQISEIITSDRIYWDAQVLNSFLHSHSSVDAILRIQHRDVARRFLVMGIMAWDLMQSDMLNWLLSDEKVEQQEASIFSLSGQNFRK